MSDDIITEEEHEERIDKFGKVLEDMKDEYEGFLVDLRKIPESEKSKKIGMELNGLLESINNSVKLREKIQKELLPKLKRKLEEEEK